MMTFDLTQANSAVTGVGSDSGPYVQVTINLTSGTTATITFNSLVSSGGDINLFGSGGAVAVNVNAGSWTVSNITGSNGGNGFTSGPLSDGGSGSEDGFGSFNQQISSFDGYTHSSDTISFILTDTSGTWSGAADVLVDNGPGGSLAAAHDYVTENPADAGNGALGTGFVADGADSPEAIPDGGSTMIMLGTALIGLAKGRVWLGRQ
jgi:hypothetical protein